MKNNARESSLIKNTLIISIGTICTKLITFLLLPLYTGILTTEEYGIVDLLNTLVSLLLPIVTFQSEQAVFRELINVRNDEYQKKEIISNGFFSILLQCSIYLLFFLLLSPMINSKYKIFLAINVIANIFSSFLLQVSRGLGDNKKYTVGSFFSASSTILFNILFLTVIKLRVNGMLLGTLIGQLTCIIYLLFSLKLIKYISIKVVTKKFVKKLWKYSLPLVPNAISWWIFNASDKVIVSTVLGLSMNGILSATSKFSSIYITLYNIFNMSWTESIALHINDEDINEYFNNMFNLILNLFISLAIIIIAIMPFIFPIMIHKSYNSGYTIIPILILGSMFNVVVGLISVIYVAKKNTKAIANTSIISALLNIIIHISLIKYIGLYAAAISTFLSYFIMSIYRLYDIQKKYFKIKLNTKIIISSSIVMTIAIFIYYINNIYLNIISLIFVTIYIITINKNSFKLIFELIHRKLRKE